MPISGPAPLTIVFTFTGTPDVTAWSWNFGDGNTSALENPSNTYAVAGTYTVVLIVTAATGTATISDTVTVTTGSSSAWTQPDPAYGLSVGGDPQMMLRISNDGGKTWVMEQWRSAGKVGDYDQRVTWDRLGSARRRVFEVSVTDPTPWKITGAYLESFVGGGGEQGG